MKRKVFLAIIFTIIFFAAGGIYVTKSFFTITATLQHIIVLQRMDFSNKTFVDNIETLQTYLLLKDTPHALDFNAFYQHVQKMEDQLKECVACHHAVPMSERIQQLQEGIGSYLHGLSRTYTVKTDRETQLEELDRTFAQGNKLVEKVNDIIAASASRLSDEASMARFDIAKTNLILIIMVTIGPLIFIITAFYFLRGFTGSLTVLTRATRKLKSGKLQYRIEEPLKDEFGELADSFNDMAVSLQEQWNRLQETERLAVVGELAAGIAHEVKNPLAGIKVSIEVLCQELDLDQEDREVFLQIVNEINRLNSLLKNLLNYARPPKPEYTSFDIHQLLDAAISSARFSLQRYGEEEESRKHIEIITEYSPEVTKVFADPGQLQQVILNLLLNAGDAIAEQGTITVLTRQKTVDIVEITVSDTGKGIESEMLDKVFKPFYTTKSNGTGLGLAICKSLIEQNRLGRLTVANNPDGTGVTFTITLPSHPITDNGEVQYET